jgi:hypothetical protein
MTTFYVIKWNSLVNGRAGKGTRHFEKQDAQQLVQELNRDYPQIQHEAVAVEPETDSQAVPRARDLAEAA